MHIRLGRQRAGVRVNGRPLSPVGKVVVCIILTLVGIGALVGAYFLSDQTRTFLKVAAHTQGEVLDLIREPMTNKSGSRRESSTVYFPEIGFTTASGIRVEFKGSSGSSSPSYYRGQKVDILYDPAAPNNARINSWFELWGPSIIVGIFGIIFLLIGILPALFLAAILFFASRNSNARPPPPPPGR